MTAELGAWLQPLLDRLPPPQVRRLARSLASGLRRRQSMRIAAQRNPDGTPYAPRRQRMLRQPAAGPLRQERERIGAMFEKLRTSTYLRIRVSTAEAGVAIEGRSARIARIHQFGLVDQPQAGGPHVRYAVRELLGFEETDRAWVQAHITRYLLERGGGATDIKP